MDDITLQNDKVVITKEQDAQEFISQKLQQIDQLKNMIDMHLKQIDQIQSQLLSLTK